jgi:hypothetical protein
MRLMTVSSHWRSLAVVALVISFTLPALAQDTRETWIGDFEPIELPAGLDIELGPADNLMLVENGLPHVVLTGYWPPTNEMLRQFSPDPNQNLSTWVGENWEGRGYNVYAFFPEFPGGTGTNPKGNGDFEVDYQDTTGDWWPLMEAIKPIGIITFSRANTTKGWELEGGNGNYVSSLWSNDYLDPKKPLSDAPMMLEPPPNQRFSSQPIDRIIAAVTDSGADVDPFSTTIDSGRFLSNYIGYLGNWWKDLHDDPNAPDRCYVGGHIHVGRSTNLPDAILATEVTLRTVLTHITEQRFGLGDMNCDGLVNSFDIDPFVLALLDEAGYAAAFPACLHNNADVNGDTFINSFDIDPFVALILAQ